MKECVEFYFKDLDTGSEAMRKYEVSNYDDAIDQFHDEFPDAKSRPRVYRVQVNHLN